MKKIIACDIDDTVSTHLPERMREEYRRRGLQLDLSKYDSGVPKEVMVDVHDRLVLDGCLLEGEPDHGVVEVLHSLTKSHHIFYLTARSLYDRSNPAGRQLVQEHTRAALARWNLPNPHDVVFCKAHEKGVVCVERRVDYVIEDAVDNLRWIYEHTQARNHQIRMFLKVRQSNRNHDLHALGVVELECFTHLPKHLDLPSISHLEQAGRT